MARYIVCVSQAVANNVQRVIFGEGPPAFSAAGYTITDDSHIIGKVLGVDAPHNKLTSSWDEPRQRLDGKWIVAHPADQTGGWVFIADNAMGKLGPVTIEEYDPSWFAPAI